MALPNMDNLKSGVSALRNQGLTDSLIMEEMTKKGHAPEHVHQAINAETTPIPTQPPVTMPARQAAPSGPEGNIYERIE